MRPVTAGTALVVAMSLLVLAGIGANVSAEGESQTPILTVVQISSTPVHPSLGLPPADVTLSVSWNTWDGPRLTYFRICEIRGHGFDPLTIPTCRGGYFHGWDENGNLIPFPPSGSWDGFGMWFWTPHELGPYWQFVVGVREDMTVVISQPLLMVPGMNP